MGGEKVYLRSKTGRSEVERGREEWGGGSGNRRLLTISEPLSRKSFIRIERREEG